MNNRIDEYLKGVKLATPNRKKKKGPVKAKIPRYWVIERPAIQLLNEGVIDDSEFVLLLRIENLCYYDREGHLHPFYGSNKYLASLAKCSVRSLQRRLTKLKDMGLLVIWVKTQSDEFGASKSQRYIITKWTRSKVWRGKE